MDPKNYFKVDSKVVFQFQNPVPLCVEIRSLNVGLTTGALGSDLGAEG